MSLVKHDIHPGEILSELYLTPAEMSAGELASSLGVSREVIENLIAGNSGISPELALRLSRYFSTSPQYWLNMQVNFDLEKETARIGDDIETIRPRPIEDAA